MILTSKMFKTILIVFVIFSVSVNPGGGSRILVVSPMPSRSDSMLSDSIVNILLQAGHEVKQYAESSLIMSSFFL